MNPYGTNGLPSFGPFPLVNYRYLVATIIELPSAAWFPSLLPL